MSPVGRPSDASETAIDDSGNVRRQAVEINRWPQRPALLLDRSVACRCSLGGRLCVSVRSLIGRWPLAGARRTHSMLFVSISTAMCRPDVTDAAAAKLLMSTGLWPAVKLLALTTNDYLHDCGRALALIPLLSTFDLSWVLCRSSIKRSFCCRWSVLRITRYPRRDTNRCRRSSFFFVQDR